MLLCASWAVSASAGAGGSASASTTSPTAITVTGTGSTTVTCVKAGRFQCPKHDSKYQPDGTFMPGHATRGMDRFAIRRDGDALVVDVVRWFQSDRQAAEWAAARVDL